MSGLPQSDYCAEYRIYSLIDPDTGEIRPFPPDLAHQVQELHDLMQAMVKAQAQRDLFRKAGPAA